MDNYDGSVVIKTGIDTEGFVAGSKELARDAQKAADEIKNISVQTRASINNQIASFARANDAFREQEAEVERLRQSLVELQQAKVETDEYKAVSAELDKASNEMDKLLQKEREMIYLGKAGDGVAAWENLVDKIGFADEKIADLKMRLQNMRDAGEQYRPADTLAAEAKLAAAEKKRDAMLSSINYKYIALRERIRGLGQAATDTHKKVQKHSGMTFKNMLKYAFGIRSIFVLFRRLRQVAKESLGVMAQSDPALNKSISRLLTSFKQLKADIGTIVQPIVQTVAPVIATIFDKIHGISLGIASFFAAFVGQDYIEKATVSAYDYADALNDVSDSAEKALGSYDKLNVISDNDKDKKASLALTKDTVKYTKQALDDDSWTVKLGRRLGELWRTASEAVTTLFERLQECPWFTGMVENLKKLLSNPDALLITIGAIGIGKALGGKLLAGVEQSGFSSGISNLIPKTAVIAVTAVVAFKVGEWIYDKLPEGLQNEIGKTVSDLVEGAKGGVASFMETLAEKFNILRTGGRELDAGDMSDDEIDFFTDEVNALKTAGERFKEAWQSNGLAGIIDVTTDYMDTFNKYVLGNAEMYENTGRAQEHLAEFGEQLKQVLKIADDSDKLLKLEEMLSRVEQNPFLYKAYYDTIKTAIENVKARLKKDDRKNAEFFNQRASVAVKKGIEKVNTNDIAGALTSTMRNVGEAAQEAFRQGVTETGQTESTLKSKVQTMISGINGQQFRDKGFAVGGDFFNGIGNAAKIGSISAQRELQTEIGSISAGINGQALNSKGQAVGTSFTQAITSSVSGAANGIRDVVNNMLSTARDGVNSEVFYDKGKNVGTRIGNGVYDGITTNAGTLASNIANAMNSIVSNANKSISGSDFWSKGVSLGEGMGRGVVEGVAGQGQNIAKTLVEKVLNAVTSAYNVATPTAKAFFEPLLSSTTLPAASGTVAAVSSGDQTINLTLDGKIVSQVVWDNTAKVYKQTGKTNLLY